MKIYINMEPSTQPQKSKLTGQKVQWKCVKEKIRINKRKPKQKVHSQLQRTMPSVS